MKNAFFEREEKLRRKRKKIFGDEKFVFWKKRKAENEKEENIWR